MNGICCVMWSPIKYKLPLFEIKVGSKTAKIMPVDNKTVNNPYDAFALWIQGKKALFVGLFEGKIFKIWLLSYVYRIFASIIASAQRIPSTAEEVIPPAYPAPSPQG